MSLNNSDPNPSRRLGNLPSLTVVSDDANQDNDSPWGIRINKKYGILVENENVETRAHFIMMGIPYETFDGLENLISSDYQHIIISYNELFERISVDYLIKILTSIKKSNKKIIVTQLFCDEGTLMCRILQDQRWKKILKPFINNLYFLYTGDLEESTAQKLKDYQLVQIGSGELWDEPDFFECKQGFERSADFMLTMIIQNKLTLQGTPKRPGRPLLAAYLDQEGLLKYHRGAINIEENNQVLVGDTREKEKRVRPGVPWNIWKYSMQWPLYEQCAFEIVPETSHEFLNFPTEKTYKPMVARMPFLILANPEYYNWLHSLGFRTFDSLIDESFAVELDLDKRVQKLVNTAKSIIDQGSLDFYHAAKEICEYNRKHLMYTQIKELTNCRQKFWNFYTGLK